MLRFLGKEENVVKFQKFCGLSWKKTSEPGNVWTAENDFSNNSSDHDDSSGYHSSSSEKEAHDNIKEKLYTQKPVEYTSNPILHRLFMFGAELGNEIFYITFLPFVYWNVDDYIARRLIMLWVFNMYAGQGLKDILCWPRPKSPPVLRLETNYVAEYGMPSTHAIAGSIIPFGLVYFSYGRFEYSLVYGILFFMVWTSLVCLSRIYLGMHTFQDVVAGLFMAAFVTALWLPYLDGSLEIFLASSNAWIFIVLVPILMIHAFPTKSMVTRNDTATIISVGCGCMLASWTDYYIDQVPIPDLSNASPRPMISTSIITWILFSTSRFVIGVSLLILVKIVIKTTMKTFASFLQTTDTKRKVTDRGGNESFTLLYLFTTYGAIGYTAVYVAPKAFDFVGLIH